MKRLLIALMLFAAVAGAQVKDTLKVSKTQLDTILVRGLYAGVNVKEFGAKGDSITDDHIAIQNALNAGAASGREVYFPAGKYRTSSGFSTIVAQNSLLIRGASRFTSTIKLTGSGNLFTIGTFHSSPANSYVGEGQDYHLTDIRLEGLDRHAEDDGLRTKIGIQDNGSGGGVLDRVAFSGFKYGFQATYGSDFTHFTESYFEFCDTALYLGPNSNQTAIVRTTVGNCVVGIIIEGAYQGVIDNSTFADQTACDIMFRAAATVLSGVTTNPAYELSYRVKNCWFESDANPSVPRIPPRHIWLAGDPKTSLPRYVRITEPLLIAGSTPSGTDAFVEMQTGIRLFMDGLLVYGNEDTYAVKVDTPAYFPEVFQSNTRTVDGYTPIQYYNINNTGLYYNDPVTLMINTVRVLPGTKPAAPATGILWYTISGGSNPDTLRTEDHLGNIKQIMP